MELEELLETIVTSDREDWHSIPCWGADSGPSYRDLFTFYEMWDGERGVLKAESHAYAAVYKPDVSITLAFGLRHVENFQEEWANQFPDPHASSSYVDVFYNNALVYRNLYVTVDGGRASLPLVTRKFEQEKVVALEVPRSYHDFIRLISGLKGSSDMFEDYFARAGIKIVEEPWPKL
jgi:hypothetical protein